MQEGELQGHAIALLLYDVSEEIQLSLLKEILDARQLQNAFKHAAAEYVRFERPPVVESLEPEVLSWCRS